MRWIDKVKRGLRSWLNVNEASPLQIQVNETLDYETNAIKNRIWYRGDSNELAQLYGQINSGIDAYKFWACRSTPGMEIRKVHTGLPSLIVDTLTTVSLADMMDFAFKVDPDKEIWEQIDQENKFKKKLEKAVKETLYIGDGAFKITFDTIISEFPIIEFYPGDRIEVNQDRGRLKEIIFKTAYEHKHTQYVLYETYGFGYIKNALYRGEAEVDLKSIPQTENLIDIAFAGYTEGNQDPESAKDRYMLAVPLQFFESGKWDGRGQSIYDRKVDSFDSFDEAWSQWMDALRAGRAKEYIPETLIPKHPDTGQIMKPNHFDNRFILTDADMSEGAQNKIEVEQPDIPHDSYLASYVTALDLCLQGIVSPSTLGIDMKKLDNADAQREKEKATLYSRNAIIRALEEDVPELVKTAIRAYKELHSMGQTAEDIEITVDFGEYANPSFESKIETVGKGKTQGIMSIEASVEELYGDSKDEDWKKEEVERLKAEQGITDMEEPSVNQEADGFELNVSGSEDTETNPEEKNVEPSEKGQPMKGEGIPTREKDVAIPAKDSKAIDSGVSNSNGAKKANSEKDDKPDKEKKLGDEKNGSDNRKESVPSGKKGTAGPLGSGKGAGAPGDIRNRKKRPR